jgi:hypothetical protein
MRLHVRRPDLEFDFCSGVLRGGSISRPRFERGVDLSDPYARFFVAQNPGYVRGDAIVIISPLTFDNLVRAGWRSARGAVIRWLRVRAFPPSKQ